MNRLLGYSFIGVGLLGFFFFLNYKGTEILFDELWFTLSIFIIIAGGYFFAKHKLQNLRNQRVDRNSIQLSEIEQLKFTGDKVRVTLDNAEVISKSYQKEIINNGLPTSLEMLDALYDSNQNYKTETIQQTYIVFYKQYRGRTYKFVSQATTQNADDVKSCIDRQNGINLYIDPMTPGNYYFDFQFMWHKTAGNMQVGKNAGWRNTFFNFWFFVGAFAPADGTQSAKIYNLYFN